MTSASGSRRFQWFGATDRRTKLALLSSEPIGLFGNPLRARKCQGWVGPPSGSVTGFTGGNRTGGAYQDCVVLHQVPGLAFVVPLPIQYWGPTARVLPACK